MIIRIFKFVPKIIRFFNLFVSNPSYYKNSYPVYLFYIFV